MAVFDGAAFQQLLTQVRSWQQQLQAMQLQLTQLRQTNAVLTGSRGMQLLYRLTPAQLNYLPGDAASLAALTAGNLASAYPSLAASISSQQNTNAILTGTDLARLPPVVTNVVLPSRSSVAADQALSRAAYEQGGTRFTSVSALIDQIGSAADAKAVADLQARIQGEQTLIANELAKLTALSMVSAADRNAQELKRREVTVASQGTFSTRFQPTPPVP
jgi:type IV secretion system protein VirB5